MATGHVARDWWPQGSLAVPRAQLARDLAHPVDTQLVPPHFGRWCLVSWQVGHLHPHQVTAPEPEHGDRKAQNGRSLLVWEGSWSKHLQLQSSSKTKMSLKTKFVGSLRKQSLSLAWPKQPRRSPQIVNSKNYYTVPFRRLLLWLCHAHVWSHNLPNFYIPCEITMVTSDRAFCNTKRRDSLQNDVFICFCFFQLCPKTDYHWSKKVDALQNGLARETQFHPKPSKSNVQIVSTLKIIQYPPSQSTWHFLQNGWGREEVKSVNFQWHFYALPQYSPLFLYFNFFSYKMTFCKAPDVTHSVEEIPQGILLCHPLSFSLHHDIHDHLSIQTNDYFPIVSSVS